MTLPSPDALNVLRLLGHLMVDHGNANHGMLLLQAVEALQPGDRWTRRALARACVVAGEPAAGLQLVHRMRADGDEPALTWLLEGRALQGMGRSAEANRAYREFVRLRTPPAGGAMA